jgi:ATP-dependent DNA ligase
MNQKKMARPIRSNEKLITEILKDIHVYEKKYDGTYVILSSDNNNWKLEIDRSYNEITPKFTYLLKDMKLIPNSYFGCELIFIRNDCGLESWSNMESYIHSSKNEASIFEKLSKIGRFQLVVLFATQINGEPLTNETYGSIKEKIKEAVKLIHHRDVILPEEIKVKSIEEAFVEIKKRGIEGLILKSLKMPVTLNPRNKTKAFVKLKGEDTVDLVLYDYEYGTSGTKGKRKKIVAKAGLFKDGVIKHVTNVSNFTFEIEDFIKKELDEKRLVVVEVKYFKKTATSIISPRFMRIRTDKNPRNCLWDDEMTADKIGYGKVSSILNSIYDVIKKTN